MRKGLRERAAAFCAMRCLAQVTLRCALLLATTPFCSGICKAQTAENWQPYRPTKLTTPEAGIRYRSSELGIEPQEIPNPRRTPAPPRRTPPGARPRPVPQPETSPETLPEALPPKTEVEPAAPRPTTPPTTPPPAAAPRTEPRLEPGAEPSRRELGPLTGELIDPAAWQDSILQGEHGEYLDEFDLMPPGDELYGYGVLGGPPNLSKFKSGFFQKLNLQATVVDPGQTSGLGITEVDTFLTVALPAPTTDFPLLITPSFDARFLSGPVAPDVPAELYSTGIDFMWVPKVNDQLRGVISVAPMVYSDFQSQDADMFRLTGKGIVQWDVVPEKLQLMGGVLFLNREDVRLLPVAGVIWNPTPYWNLELIFPRPKLARLLRYGADHSDWVYLLGEFGGNSWAVRRDSGLQDVVTLGDLRLMVGLERRKNGGVNYRCEVGYVFAREVDYASTEGTDFTPDDTLLLRLGATF